MMRMRYKAWPLAVAVLLLAAAPVALAQDGDGDKVLFGQRFTLRGGEQYNVVVTFHSREQEEWGVRPD